LANVPTSPKVYLHWLKPLVIPLFIAECFLTACWELT